MVNITVMFQVTIFFHVASLSGPLCLCLSTGAKCDIFIQTFPTTTAVAHRLGLL